MCKCVYGPLWKKHAENKLGKGCNVLLVHEFIDKALQFIITVHLLEAFTIGYVKQAKSNKRVDLLKVFLFLGSTYLQSRIFVPSLVCEGGLGGDSSGT